MTMPRALWWSWGGGGVLMREVPLYFLALVNPGPQNEQPRSRLPSCLSQSRQRSVQIWSAHPTQATLESHTPFPLKGDLKPLTLLFCEPSLLLLHLLPLALLPLLIGDRP